jgi:hypothetical protein
MDGVEFLCRYCLKQTSICRRCWKNQSYCSKVCAFQSRKKSQGFSQARYALTTGGQESQKRRDNTYRNKKTTTEHSSKSLETKILPSPLFEVGLCHRCGGRISFLWGLNQLSSRSVRRQFAHTRSSG